MVQARIVADFLDDRIAVHAGHHQAQHDDVRNMFVGQAQPLGPVIGS